MKTVLYILLFSLLLFTSSGHAEEKPAPVELIFGHTGNTGSIHDLTAREFARRVNTELRGKVFVRIAGASELGNEAEMLEKVKRGDIAFCLPAPTLIRLDAVFAVLELPYLVLSREHIKRVREKLLNEYFRPAAAANGIQLLAMWENGFRHITNNVRPIVTPADLVGIKIRISQGSRLKVGFKQYGANPEEFPFGQPLYNALKTGQFDGQENPFGNIYTAKLQEVQKYLSLTSHQYGTLYLVTSTKQWAALPPKAQRVISKAAEDLQDWSMQLGQQMDQKLRATLGETMQINEVDTLAFLLASLPIYLNYAKEVPKGKELIRLLYDKTSLSMLDQHH